MKAALSALAATALAGCATTPATANPQDAFFEALAARCGKAYAGKLASDEEADAGMRGKAMVMHIRHCSADRIEIPFHIDGPGADGGWDRSRTWIISRTTSGLRLRHDHRHADGTPDAVTLYGGNTVDTGSATRQTFPVDAESIAMFTATGRNVSNTNIWSVETTDAGFTYGLNREGRHFRVAFDYARPVTPPPAPWGW